MRLAILLISIVAFLPACRSGGPLDRSAAEWEQILESPKRDAWQQPGQVIAALRLRPDEIVADIGAGSGYFTRRFVPVVKSVYAVEVDPALLAIITRNKPPNVVPVLAARDDPRLPLEAIDTIFICNVLHHITNRPAYYVKLQQALRANGRVVVVDYHKRNLPVGPPLAMKLSESEVINEFTGAGFRLAQRYDELPYQYMLEFKR